MPRCCCARGSNLADGPRASLQGKKVLDESSKTLGKTAKIAAGSTLETVKKVKRQAKERTSSDFEKLLLRATAPTNAPVDPEDTTVLLKAIRAFPSRPSQLGINP